MAYYKGWLLVHLSVGPVTGSWRAAKDGVTVCASSREALYAIIDAREQKGDGCPG